MRVSRSRTAGAEGRCALVANDERSNDRLDEHVAGGKIDVGRAGDLVLEGGGDLGGRIPLGEPGAELGARRAGGTAAGAGGGIAAA